MNKKYILFIAIALVFALSPFGQAMAVTAEELQTQIQSLLESIKAIQGQLENIQPTQNTTTNPVNPVPPISTTGFSCITLSHNLYLGLSDSETNGEISWLQKYLTSTGDFTHPTITGYFGPATERAVQNWQKRNGVVSAGDPESTGYGVIGPATREAIRRTTCSQVVQPQPETNLNFKASPSYGSAPLRVNFSASGEIPYSDTPSYYVHFGDGNQSDVIVSLGVCAVGASGSCSYTGLHASHTYSNPGTYTATLQKRYSCPSSQQKCIALYSTQIASVVVTVSDTTPAPTPTITVLSPNGGEIIPFENESVITWRTNTSGTVYVYLQDVNGGLCNIGSSPAYHNKFNFIPESNCKTSLGGKYKILLILVKDGSTAVGDIGDARDTSDNYFVIEKKTLSTEPFINLTIVAGEKSSSDVLNVTAGTSFTVSGTPKNLVGSYERAWFFDPIFDFVCSNNGTYEPIWNLSCTPKTLGTGKIYVEIYKDGKTYRSNSIFVNVVQSVQSPTVDLKLNGSNGPISLSRGYTTFWWTSPNADSCTASGDTYWTGSKPVTGQQSIYTANDKTGQTTYTLTCKNSKESKSDSVVANFPSLRIISPAGGEQFNVGDVLVVKWDPISLDDTINAVLVSYKGGRTEVASMGSAGVWKGSLSWTIPSSIIPIGGTGFGYAVQLRSSLFGSPESNQFSIFGQSSQSVKEIENSLASVFEALNSILDALKNLEN